MVFNRSIVGSIMKQVSLCCTTYDTHSMLVALANSRPYAQNHFSHPARLNQVVRYEQLT